MITDEEEKKIFRQLAGLLPTPDSADDCYIIASMLCRLSSACLASFAIAAAEDGENPYPLAMEGIGAFSKEAAKHVARIINNNQDIFNRDRKNDN